MKHSLFTAALLAVLAAGCSTPTKVDEGPIHARTFSFVQIGSRPADFTDNRQAVHTVVQSAITKNLAAKGVTRVESGGDVTVGYLIVVGNPVSTSFINDYFGYSEDTVALMEKAHHAYTSRDSRNYFEAGTLLIDIVGRDGKVLWRSYATRRLLGDVSMEVREANVQSGVDEALARLRFEP